VTGEQQKKLIDQARAVLTPTKVKLSHVPRWFKKSGLFGPGRSTNKRWLDHWGSTKVNGEEAFVSEPYDIGSEALLECEEIAKRLGLVFYIDANSWHYPGRTLRLVFRRPVEGF
jgi:hypothetical protein